MEEDVDADEGEEVRVRDEGVLGVVMTIFGEHMTTTKELEVLAGYPQRSSVEKIQLYRILVGPRSHSDTYRTFPPTNRTLLDSCSSKIT